MPAVAQGAGLDSGRQSRLTSRASGPLRAALAAGHRADQSLGATDYSHAQHVQVRPHAAALALAA